MFTTSPGLLDLSDPTNPAKNKPPYVIGMAKADMLPNTKFTLRIAGLQNPRYVISWAALSGTKSEQDAMQWQIQTFGPAALSSGEDLALDEQMDVGTGGYVDVDKPTPITSFSAEAKNATNGMETTYYLTWSTVLRTLYNDRFYVVFPPETELIPTKGLHTLTCTGLNGFTSTGLFC